MTIMTITIGVCVLIAFIVLAWALLAGETRDRDGYIPPPPRSERPAPPPEPPEPPEKFAQIIVRKEESK